MSLIKNAGLKKKSKNLSVGKSVQGCVKFMICPEVVETSSTQRAVG